MSAEEHIQYVPEPAGVELRVVVGAAIAALVLLVGAIVGFYEFIRWLSRSRPCPRRSCLRSRA